MSSLLSEAVLGTTAGLVALPLVSRRFRRALRPNEHVCFNTTTMVAGLAFAGGGATGVCGSRHCWSLGERRV